MTHTSVCQQDSASNVLIVDDNSEEEIDGLKHKDPDVLDIFIQRRANGGWLITPLTRTVPLELREAMDSPPSTSEPGVIWHLDDEVFKVELPKGRGEEEELATACLFRTVPARLERVSADVQRLQSIASNLQGKLDRFQQERQSLTCERVRLEAELSDLARQRAEQQQLSARLGEDRERFNSQVSDAADHIARVFHAPVRAGEVATQPADVFFVAAQDEFARAVPRLNKSDAIELQNARLTPEAAFLAATEAFFRDGSQLDGLVESLVRALLAFECLEEQQDQHGPGRIAQALEQLSGISQALSRRANAAGHMPLAFAASSCATWCALHLTDHLALRLEEAHSSEFVKETDPRAANHLLKQAKSLAQFAKVVQRLLRAWSDHPDHRRRFIRFMANKATNLTSEADLRLLFLTPDATTLELVAHVRRLSSFVDKQQSAIRSRYKRTRPTDADTC